MKRKPRPERPRQTERALRRSQDKLVESRERLFLLEPGGSALRPLPITSASVVEAHALAVPCPRCGAPHELLEHAAVVVEGVRLREARLRCRQCGSRRSLYFRLRDDRPN